MRRTCPLHELELFAQVSKTLRLWGIDGAAALFED
jgi:hypothetical protein